LASEGLQPEEGIVVIPTKVVERPKITVGTGDVISGSAFVAEPWK
jgi:ADP-dependent phosphofructokinase/glucokinase